MFAHMNKSTRPWWRDEAERQGISLRTLADRTGVSHRAIYAYSQGQRRPSDAWLDRVFDVLTGFDQVRAAS